LRVFAGFAAGFLPFAEPPDVGIGVLLRSIRGVAPLSSKLIVAATASMWLYSSAAILQMSS
jgi:hypothetical protein